MDCVFGFAAMKINYELIYFDQKWNWCMII